MSDDNENDWYSEGDFFDDLETVDEDPGMLNRETYEALKRINETLASQAEERKAKAKQSPCCPTCGPHDEDDDEKDDEYYRDMERHMGLKIQLEDLTGAVESLTEEIRRLKSIVNDEG